MSRASEAKKILELVAAGRFRVAEHTFVRANQRSISQQQIVHCAANCLYHSWQEQHETHLFIGYLDANVTGGFSAVIRDGVIIVTVFKRRLTRWEKNLVKYKKT